jgi:ABC-type transport system involved in cytochrome c biogenesis permease component
MSAPSGITRVTLLKDLRLEWRSKDAINSMLFFSLLVVVVFSFSFDPSAEESRQIAGGLIWVAFLFRGGGGAEPNLGARDSQSGAGRLPGIAGSGELVVCG